MIVFHYTNLKKEFLLMFLMVECFKCGIQGGKALLFEVISGKGIVSICNNCYRKENLPLVKKPTEFRLNDFEKKESVYEKINRVAGVNAERKKVFEKNKYLFQKKDEDLRKIVNENFLSTIRKEAKPREDLINNFHWVIMRARRSKHMTQKQVAEIITEPELAIKMAEQGVLGEHSDALIKKLENYLRINLRKGQSFIPKQEDRKKEVSFDVMRESDLTISDIKEMEEMSKPPFWKRWGRKKTDSSSEEKKLEEDKASNDAIEDEFVFDETKRELSSEDVDDLIFGRK